MLNLLGLSPETTQALEDAIKTAPKMQVTLEALVLELRNLGTRVDRLTEAVKDAKV